MTPRPLFPRVPRPKAAPRKKSTPKPKAAVHVFVWDATSDWRGTPTCGTCGGLRTDSVHDLRPTPKGANEIDSRRIGEGGKS